MKTYQGLYGIIWLILTDILIQSKAVAFPGVEYAHMALGAGTILLALVNYQNVVATSVPDRTKRITRIYMQLSIGQAIMGVLVFLFFIVKPGDVPAGVCFRDAFRVIHLVIAIAMITQAAAAAISYDMWEDKEFLKESISGEPPEPLPKPKAK